MKFNDKLEYYHVEVLLVAKAEKNNNAGPFYWAKTADGISTGW